MADQNAAPTTQAGSAGDDAPVGSAQRKNSLEKHLMGRPDRAELIQKNILPASNAAPGIQAQQKELEKSMRADSLNEKIAHRPTPETLIKEGVLHEDPRSPDEKYAEAIEDEYAKREGGA